MKAWLKDVFVTNWETTSAGLITMADTLTRFCYAWGHPPEGAAPGMPDPSAYVVPFLTALFLVLRARDPGKGAGQRASDLPNDAPK